MFVSGVRPINARPALTSMLRLEFFLTFLDTWKNPLDAVPWSVLVSVPGSAHAEIPNGTPNSSTNQNIHPGVGTETVNQSGIPNLNVSQLELGNAPTGNSQNLGNFGVDLASVSVSALVSVSVSASVLKS